MHPLLQENKKTFALATPIIAGQLSQMLLGLADTLMIGRVGTVELAAAAFVNVLFHFPFVLAIGLFVAVSVQISHAYGADRLADVGETFRTGLLVSVLAGLALTAGLLLSIPFLDLFRQPGDVTRMSPSYLFWVALSLIPMIPAMTVKAFVEALNRPWTIFWIMLGGVALNVGLNYLLIFGNGGFPALGLQGAGIATFIARALTLAVVWIYLTRSAVLAPSRPSSWAGRPDPSRVKDLFRISVPIAGQLTMEFGAFAMCALLIGQFGSAALAAHQITISCAATSFMIPLGLSMALTIRVGHSLGKGERERCRRIITAAHLASLGIMLCTALLFIGFGPELAALFTPDSEVILIAGSLLAIAALFQLADGAQIIANGALRGMRDVNRPALLIFVSFWVIGLPLGIFLGFERGLEASGMWIGLALGIGLAAIALSLRAYAKVETTFEAAPHDGIDKG